MPTKVVPKKKPARTKATPGEAVKAPAAGRMKVATRTQAEARNPKSDIAGRRVATPGQGGQPAKARRPPGTAPARVNEILRRLNHMYPGAECALIHRSAWQLLVATILSAQCTDERVNKVTPGLFRKYPTIRDLAALTPEALEPEIRSTGFYRNKAKSVVGAARKIMSDFGGRVPETMEELLALPGVARKTANVVLGVAFNKATGVVVDTHVYRVSRRLDLTREDTPEKIEQDLMKILPQDRWISFSHEVIWHGRQRCTARKPKCTVCELDSICYAADKWKPETLL